MTDTKRESLSALIDGEASEIEVHRLLREFRSAEGLVDRWAIYQQVRTTVRRGAEPVSSLTPAHHQALFDRISDAIDAEDAHQRAPLAATSSTRVVLGTLALAASLVVAIFIGVQQPEDATNLVDAGQSTPVEVQTVSNTVADQQTPELVELDEEKQRRLRAYLNQHDRMARTNSNEQWVNFKQEPAGK